MTNMSAIELFLLKYPHAEQVRLGSVHVGKDFDVSAVVYQCGLEWCLAFVYRGPETWKVILANIQHTGNDYDLGQVRYFFDDEPTALPAFAVAVRNTTARLDAVTGDVLLVSLAYDKAVSCVARTGAYAREGAFLGAVVDVDDVYTPAFYIQCQNGANYLIEGNGESVAARLEIEN